MYGVYPYGSTPYGSAPLGSAPSATVTSERFLILTPRESDLATLTASSAVASLPVTNLQTMQPSQVWRSTAATAQYIDVVFPYPVAANALAIVATNATASGVFRARGANTSAEVTASPAVDTGFQSMWPVSGKPNALDWPVHVALLRWSNDALYQYWRVDIADAGTVLTYLEAGRLALGRAWQPTTNFDFGGTVSYAPADVQLQTPYGRTFTDRRTVSPPRIFEIGAYSLNKREAFDGIVEVQRLRGTHGDIICALDPGESTDFHRFTMQGVFTSGGAYTLPPAFDSAGFMIGFGAGIRLRELI